MSRIKGPCGHEKARTAVDTNDMIHSPKGYSYRASARRRLGTAMRRADAGVQSRRRHATHRSRENSLCPLVARTARGQPVRKHRPRRPCHVWGDRSSHIVIHPTVGREPSKPNPKSSPTRKTPRYGPPQTRRTGRAGSGKCRCYAPERSKPAGGWPGRRTPRPTGGTSATGR